MAKKNLSANGAILLAGSGGSLLTTAGTWTFGTATSSGGTAPSSGGYAVLLNGKSTGLFATELLIDNGNLYADNAQGQWSEWIRNSWVATASPAPTVSAASLTVAENAGATAIGIRAPSDPNYAASQLVVKVTGLPGDGTVLLPDGVTAVTAGETLTVAQLTGLVFKPTAGVFGQSSAFTYTVTDPAGLSTTGSATLAIGTDTSPPTVSAASLTVAENAAPAAIGITAPSDRNYAASQLVVKVTGLPGDGTVLLSDGVTAVTAGETLTVAQLTGLMFKPTAGVFGQSSAFTYMVTDPAGLSTTGSATLAIGPDTSPPTVSAASLTVGENAAPVAIGITAPSDPSYTASQLVVTVTGLPSDGTVLLSDGVTRVSVGETLTVAALVGLMFQPTSGVFGQNSSFTYTVTNPSGLSSTGSAALTIGPDTSPPTVNAASLTVAENAGATAIGITAPSDPNYAASQLVVKVTGLPGDGTVLLSDGVTAVTPGETLTVAQLTGLVFKPTAGVFGQSSAFTYTVTDPAGLSTTGSATLVIGPATVAGLSPDGTVLHAGSGSSLVTSAGTWTFGAVTGSGGYDILLNGQWAAGGSAVTLEVANNGNMYAYNSNGQWFEFLNAGWSGCSDPNVLTVDPDTLTVAENAPATPMSIVAPTDSTYSASQLKVAVTAVPTNGTVVLADGVTPITLGESLTVAQLTGLEFRPTSNLASGSSNFAYTVTDPSGNIGSGSTILTIGTSTTGNSVDGSTLQAAAGGSLVTGAGTWTFSTATGGGGYDILLNGQWAAGGSAVTLEVANNGNMYAYNSTGQWFEWVNGGWSQVSSPNVSGPGTNSGVVDTLPTVLHPSQIGDIVGVNLQNAGSGNENSGYVTFGEVFADGAVRPTDSLVARINGINYAVQMDVKSTNADGSVRQAVITLDAPSIAAGGTIELMLAKGTASAPSPAAPSASALLASGYNTSVGFTFHNADGTTTTDNISAAAVLQAALSAGTVKQWLSGPEVNEYDVVGTVDGGKLKVEFDIRAYANGTTTTDVIFDNSWMFSPGKTDLNYDVTISQSGQQVYSATGIRQYLYSMWDHQVASVGTINPNVQYDVPYLESTGAIPAYDTSNGVSNSSIQTNYNGLNATNTGPLGTAEVTTYMPSAGGRSDIGPQPNWVAQWLLTQNPAAYQVMMADAEASGGVPWHFTDESTGEPINGQTYPSFFQNGNSAWYPSQYLQPANGWPTETNTGLPSADGDPWVPDASHMPDLNYMAYLTSGSHYQLSLLQAEADYAITSVLAANPSTDLSGTVPLGWTGSSQNGNQTRAIAWEMREIADAAYITPDNDPLKAYFVNELDLGMKALVQQYIVDGINSRYGQLNGFIEGSTGPNYGEVAWEEFYVVTSLADVAALNIPQASQQAVQMLEYMNPFISGLFTNGPNGFNPISGAIFWLNVNDPSTGAPYTSWSQLYAQNVAPGWINPTQQFIGQPNSNFSATDPIGGPEFVARAALADEITFTESPQAIQAYGLVVSQMAYVFAQPNAGTEAQAYQSAPLWDVAPRLPDGVYLQNSQMQIDTSNAPTVNLTGVAGQDVLLAVVGSGTATLTSNSAAGGNALLYGGAGPTTLIAGAGNDYMFGGGSGASYMHNSSGSSLYGAQQATTFVDGTGNDYMDGGPGANTYVFKANSVGPRATTIANFNLGTDQLQVAANIDGSGMSSASQLIAGATVSNGNTVLHLSPNDNITLVGVSTPSSLLNHILVS